MPIQVTCGECRKSFHVRDDFAGKRGKCPTCGAVVEVPGTDVNGSSRTDLSSGSRSASRRRENEDDFDTPSLSRGRSPDREDDDRPRSRRDREDDYEEERPRKRSSKYDKLWIRAASGATPLQVGAILFAVGVLFLIICELGAFSLGRGSQPTRSDLERVAALGRNLMFGNPVGATGVGYNGQIWMIVQPAHQIFILLGMLIILVGSIFVSVGLGRFKACPDRGVSTLSGTGAILGFVGVGLMALAILLGLIFMIASSTSDALVSIPFFAFVVASVCVLVGQLLQGIALMKIGGRYYNGGVKWFSLGVWIAFAVTILLLIIFVTSNLANNKWFVILSKASSRFNPGVDGLYFTFLIMMMIVSIVYFFPLQMAKSVLQRDEPGDPPPRSRFRDDDDDRPRSRRYRDSNDFDDQDDRSRGRRPRGRDRDDD